MTKTKSRPKKIVPRFMSIFFALCFALLCVPNLSVFAANRVPYPTIYMYVSNGGGTRTIDGDSRVKRVQKDDPYNMLASITKNGNKYTVKVRKNTSAIERPATIRFYAFPRQIPMPNEQPLFVYKITQYGKKLTAQFVSAKDENDCLIELNKIPFFPSDSKRGPFTFQFTVNSNCPFKPSSSGRLHFDEIKVIETTNGNEKKPDANGFYGLYTEQPKKYTVELDISRRDSNKVVVDVEDNKNIYSGDETFDGKAIDLFFISPDGETTTPLRIRISNFLAFSKQLSSRGIFTDPKDTIPCGFKTAFPAYAADPDNKSPYIDKLDNGEYVQIVGSADFVFTTWETITGYENNNYLPGVVKRGSYYVCWDGYKHGYLCIESELSDLVANLQPVAELDMTGGSGSNPDLCIYELEHESGGYIRSHCHRFYFSYPIE